MLGLGGGALAASAGKKAPPPAPDYAAANRAGVEAQAELLPLQIAVDRAARLGSSYTDPATGRTYDFTGMGDEQLDALDAAQTERLMRSGADIQRDLTRDQYTDLLELLPQYNQLNLQSQRDAYDASLDASRRGTANAYEQNLEYMPRFGELQRAEDQRTFLQNLDLGDIGTRRMTELQAELLPILNKLQRTEDGLSYRQNLDLNEEGARRGLDLQEELAPRLNQLALASQLDAERASWDAYRETDPQRYAMRETLLGQVNEELAAGDSLTPRQIEQLEQRMRGAQASRGNILGAGAGYDEAMMIQDAGRNERDSRRATALQILQGTEDRARFGTAGAVPLNQPAADYRSTGAVNPLMPNYQSAQPLNPSLPNFQATTTGGPNLNPVPVNSQPGFSYVNPNAGRDGVANAQNVWGQQMNFQSNQANPWMAGLSLGFQGIGAAAQAGWICWVAREVFGVMDPRWMQFRHWLLNQAPDWLRRKYLRQGERFARRLRTRPHLRAAVRSWMENIINTEGRATT